MPITVPRGTQPGCREWMETTAGLVQSWAKRSDYSVRELVGYVQQLRGHNWSTLLDGEANWPRFCKEVFGLAAEYIAEMEEGVRAFLAEAGDGFPRFHPISEDEARRAYDRSRRR